MIEERRDHATVDETMTAAQRRAHRARIVQIALGCLWILDAALQFQPRMFGTDLINQMMLPTAAGQPAPVAWSITQLAHFLRPDTGVWNFFFGVIQLGIGVGMLFRRTVKPAIVAMAIWAFGVWWFGEGFGMLLTGTASPLTGAPGAVLLYPLVGLLVWPTEEATSDVAPGIASSAAATGPLGTSAPLFAWSGFWALSAVLWLFPANRASGSVGSALRTAAGGQPSWYADFETSLANALPHQGSLLPWVLACVSLVIAAGPLLSRRAQPFLLAGAALQLAFWVSGMALGGILTGMGTDPNAAPLVALLAFAMVPTLHATPASVPGREFLRRHPGGRRDDVGDGFGGPGDQCDVSGRRRLGVGHIEQRVRFFARGSAMAGMAMGAGSSTSHSSPAGKDGGLSMPGMDGQADPNWHYTGPPLPAQETSVLTSVFNETEKGHAMQTPNCDTPPTGAQTEAAMQLVQTTSAAVAPFKNLHRGDGSGLRADHRPALSGRPLPEAVLHAGQVRPRPRSRAVVGLCVHALRAGPRRRDVPDAIGGGQGADAGWVPHAVARAHQPVRGRPHRQNLGFPDRRHLPGRSEPRWSRP